MALFYNLMEWLVNGGGYRVLAIITLIVVVIVFTTWLGYVVVGP
jgi:hypothetical protein